MVVDFVEQINAHTHIDMNINFVTVVIIIIIAAYMAMMFAC